MGKTGFVIFVFIFGGRKRRSGLGSGSMWKPLGKDTIGKQMINSADSIGANIAEGTGRGS